MADVKIQDVNLIATPTGTDKMPVSDGSGVAKTISVAQINGVHEATYNHSAYLTETSADALYAHVLGADDNYVTDAEKTKLSNLSGTNTGDQDLSGYSLTSHNHTLNDLTEKSYNSLTDKPTIPSVSGLLDETAHDLLDHTGLTGIPSITGLLDETAHDLLDHTGLTGIPAAYNLPTASTTVLGGVKVDGTTVLISNGVISSTGGSGGGVTDHGLLTGLSDDDHSQYHTDARGDARYQPIGTYSTDIHSNITALNAVSGTNTGDQDLSGYSLTTHNHSLNNLTEKSYNSLTDKPTIPSITGLLDETAHDALDHTGLTGIPAAYSLPTASTTVLGGVKVDGTTVTIADGVISSSATGGVTDHGALTGLGDDDHTQYLNETRHDLLDHSGLTGIPSITGLLDETAHDLLDHTGLTGIPTAYTDEMAQDAVGAAIVAGTQSGITVTYDDANNKIDFTVTATGTGDVTGPAGSVDSNFALFNGTTGKIIKDGSVKASDFATASHNHTGVYQPAGTYSTDIHSNITALNAVSGTNTGDQDLSGYSLTSHNHAGVYEPADATILKDAAIGVTVQAYDADLTSWAAIAPSAKQDTLISGTNIKTINGSSILGSGDLTVEGGSGMSNPMTTAGDMIYGGTDGAPTRLAKGTDGQVLTLASGLPAWAAASGGSLLVAETVVTGSAVTSVEFTGLDGNAAGGYVLVSNGQLISANYIRLYVNGDTTNTHYYTQGIQSYTNNVNVGWNNVNDTNMVYSNGDYQIILNIDIVANKLRAYCLANTESPAGFVIYDFAVKGTQTLANNNITSITLVSGASNIAVGSKFSLYRRK